MKSFLLRIHRFGLALLASGYDAILRDELFSITRLEERAATDRMEMILG